jgi:large subunit ribosomal protein L20
MPRVKRAIATKKRHKRLLKSTSGYYGPRSRSIKRAHEAQLHARAHAQRGRKIKKRDMRGVWVVRINNALRQLGDVTYATFIHQLQLANVHLDRKTLAYLADQMPDAFKAVVEFVKKAPAKAKPKA